MELIKKLLYGHRFLLIIALILNLVSSFLGVGAIAFINNYLLVESTTLTKLLQFIGLVCIFFAISIGAQILLVRLGQYFVFDMQRMIVKQILDTDFMLIQKTGKSRLLASLTNDIRSISFGLLRLPELIQGTLFVLCAGGYLFYLSSLIFWLVALWMTCTFAVSFMFIKQVHVHFRKAREHDDLIQANYTSVIEGHRELKLNQFRAKIYYETDFIKNAHNKRHHTIKGDSFHVLAGNWLNVMLLALIGTILYLSSAYALFDFITATTIVLVVFFLRTPLNAAFNALPTLLNAQVALKKILALELCPYNMEFECKSNFAHWQKLQLENVSFSYDNGFMLKPFNLEIKRGEIIFCVGKNGSGKSTLSLLLAGLLTPSSGTITVDNVRINADNYVAYRSTISAIFSDFFLFTQAIHDDSIASDETIDYWLNLLELSTKVSVLQGKLSTTTLSMGQRKRLALFIALLEKRNLLILDEWAADQDPEFRKFFYQKLIPLFKEMGLTVFAISHDNMYFDAADRVLLVKDGVISTMNSPIHTGF